MGSQAGLRRVYAGLVVAATVAVAGAGTSAADDAAPQAVVNGHARFEVLSPTLIRMEYAGDDKFADQATFNAIGRDDFGHTAFTQSVAGGWLTIATDKATLKYKVGSGPFTAQNVSLQLKAGSQAVNAAPAFPPATFICAAGTLCEAEQAQPTASASRPITAATPAPASRPASSPTGNSLTYQLDVPSAGAYDVQLRYANSLGGDNQNTTRTLTAASTARSRR